MHRSKARRSQGIKGTPGRVADLKDAAQFQKLSSKYSDRLIVLLTYTTWHASCKELRSFLNHVSSKPQYGSVIFLEADFEKDSMRPVTDSVDVESIPHIAFYCRGELLEEIKKATPSSAYQALLRLEKTVGPQTNGHAGPEQTPQGRRWRGIAKIAGAGAAVLAAGLLGYKLWSGRETESKVLTKIERVNQQIRAAQKGGGGVRRKRRRRRGAAAKANVSSTELSDLYEEKQELERRLEEIRASQSGSASPPRKDPQVQAYNILDDSSDDEYED
ncbi:g7574 [Coccomyxa viridis]|uniref:G7574 protein n=1 Tax=Coccomyxa viridis TaxID=1274662 RepID=A0ABP1FY89_9CHLO